MTAPSPLPACGERSDREAIRVRGNCRRPEPFGLRPPTPTLSPQAGEGDYTTPSLRSFSTSSGFILSQEVKISSVFEPTSGAGLMREKLPS